MSAVSIPNTFSNGGTQNADANQVNANFTALRDHINNEMVHKDGSVAMTGALVLPGTDPTNANHATRKAYVDAGARGKVGYASITSMASYVTTITDVPGLSVTWTADPLRMYLVTAKYMILQSANGLFGNVWLRDGSNNKLNATSVYCPSTAATNGSMVSAIVSGVSGSRTVKLSIDNAGSGSVTVAAHGTYPAWLLVQDIGPA